MALADPDEATVTLAGREHVTVTSPGQGVTVTSGDVVSAPLGTISLALRLVPLTDEEVEQVRRGCRSPGCLSVCVLLVCHYTISHPSSYW